MHYNPLVLENCHKCRQVLRLVGEYCLLKTVRGHQKTSVALLVIDVMKEDAQHTIADRTHQPESKIFQEDINIGGHAMEDTIGSQCAMPRSATAPASITAHDEQPFCLSWECPYLSPIVGILILIGVFAFCYWNANNAPIVD